MDDIQFGDVQEAKPQPSLRPDRDAHFAVAPYENPVAGELPIFIDLDVFLDMEAHAASDTKVELGGVLLGGQYHDDEGRPFVVITDSLRAAHYESTKASFKFTKDTWTEINQRRNEFHPDLQMVGWYHTHPDWGVFLSGADMFICDHFFNRPLDVAYVIDPCRGDRACFMWTQQTRERVRRTRGFFVTASRYRRAELEQLVAQVQGSPSMPSEQRSSFVPAPVVNITQPGQPTYPMLAVLGMLTVQTLLVALLGWKMLATTATPAPKENQELAAVAEKLDALVSQTQAQRESEAQAVVLGKVMAELKGAPSDIVTEMKEAQQENRALKSSLIAQEQRATKLASDLMDAQSTLKYKSEEYEKQLKVARDDQKKFKEETDKQLARLKAELKEFKPADEDATAAWGSLWYWVGGGVLAVLVLGGIAAFLTTQKPEPAADIDEGRLGLSPLRPTPAPQDPPTPHRAADQA